MAPLALLLALVTHAAETPPEAAAETVVDEADPPSDEAGDDAPPSRTAGLRAATTALEAPSARVESLAIYPGFERHELDDSVRATLKAALQCASQGKTLRRPRSRTTGVPYVSATVVDGEPVELFHRERELHCDAEPLRRCRYVYAWAEQSEMLGYASLQCVGSHDDRYTSYLVTAARDLRKAHKEGRVGTRRDKAVVVTSVTFQTDDFPGTHLAASVSTRRRDGRVVVPARINRFDDYQSTDDAEGSPLTPPQLGELAREALHSACVGTGAEGCDALR